MLRLIPIVALSLLLAVPVNADELCTPSEKKASGCNGPEVCMTTKIRLPAGLRRMPRCIARIDDSVSATSCFKTFVDKEGNEQASFICSLDWDGPITERSVSAAIDVIGKTDSPSLWLTITSEGGDVRAALRLGRTLRKHQAHVEPRYCASACVFVLAGGVARTIYEEGPNRGQIVIHRPYNLDVSQKSIEQTQRLYDEINNEIGQYLRDMNVPESLLDAMLAIPPHRGRTLTREELQKYRLDEYDPVYEQARNARMASEKGISMTEYLRRKALSEKCREEHFNTGKTYYPAHCYEVLDTGKIGVDQGPRTYEQIWDDLQRKRNAN